MSGRLTVAWISSDNSFNKLTFVRNILLEAELIGQTNMATIELDPMFVKALKFLHSKAKDSGAQLKALLDDVITQRKGPKASTHSADTSGKTSPGRSKSDDDSKVKDTEKRSADKGSKDNLDPDAKKTKLDLKSQSKDEREKGKERERSKKEKEKKEKEERDTQKFKEKAEGQRKEKELENIKAESEIAQMISDEEEPVSQVDAGDFALEMGIACVVCRQFDVSSGNQLVECQECHNLYHQECHKPAVTEEDVSDPRFVWYCSRCTRSLKKMMTQKPAQPKPVSVPLNMAKESLTISNKPAKMDINSKSLSQAFRWIDPKQTMVTAAEATGPNNAMSKPMVGLAGLAANLHKSKGESKSGLASRKPDQKGDGNKYFCKNDIKSSNVCKSDSSPKCDLSSKLEQKKVENLKPIIKDEKEKKSAFGSKSGNKTDERKGTDAISKVSIGKDEKTEITFRPEIGSSSHSELAKFEVSSMSSPPQVNTSLTSVTPELPSPSKGNNTTTNKQAVANLSLVTANKRIQMMKKKAQAKPGMDKKLHIK